MNTCTDSRAGALLHAYELGALRDEDLEQFEQHLIGCTSCFDEVQAFQAEAAMLRGDPEVRGLVLDEVAMAHPPAPQLGARPSAWRRLWPPEPWPLRPLVPYALLLLLVAGAAGRWFTSRPATVQPLQAITLAPGRAAEDPQLRTSTGGPAAVRFVFEDARPDQPCAVSLLAEDGTEVWSDPGFRAFDGHQSGWLLLPLSRMRPGGYRLVIRDLGQPAEVATREYRFRVVP